MVFEAANVEPGETVLVEAAAGGVGSLLVQLAAGAGARVVAAARGERKVKLARGLGADHAVDYSQPGWAHDAGPVDVVFDGVGGAIAREAFELVRTGGRFSSFGMASGTFAGISREVAADAGVTLLRGNGLAPRQLRALSERALHAAAAGHLKPVVGQRFALDNAAAAHAAIEARETIGKTLLEPRARAETIAAFGRRIAAPATTRDARRAGARLRSRAAAGIHDPAPEPSRLFLREP